MVIQVTFSSNFMVFEYILFLLFFTFNCDMVKKYFLYVKFNGRICHFFFFWFPTVYPQSFQPETNHCSQRVGPNGVNCWPREFFQSAGTRTRTGEHTQLSLGQAP